MHLFEAFAAPSLTQSREQDGGAICRIFDRLSIRMEEESHLAKVPHKVGSMAKLSQKSVATPPAGLPVQPHEAGIMAAEVSRPEAIHNAADRNIPQLIVLQLSPLPLS